METAPEALTKAGYSPLAAQENRIVFTQKGVNGQDGHEVNEQASKYVSSIGKDLISERYIKFANL